MKTKTSKKQFALRVSLLLPLVALLVYGFSINKVIEQATPVIENSTTIEHIIELKLLDNQEIWHNDTQWKLEELAKNVVNLVPEGITMEQVVIEAKTNVELNETFFENISSVLRELKIKHFQACYFETEDTMNSNEPFQQSASRKLMAEYNALAKKYNKMDSNRMRIRKSDVERLAYIYALMSDKQKANAEPFPDFPEPPARPTPPIPPLEKDVEQLQKEAKQLQKQSKKLQDASKKLEKKRQRLSHAPEPPLPPTPMEPLDHVIEMAKKGATFYYEGKKISSDKAIELLKKNKSLNFSTKNGSSTNPEVRISKKPITVGSSSKPDKLLKYVKELREHNARFYLNGEPISSEKGMVYITFKNYKTVETLPWVNKAPEVKIYSK